jgi:hypothetical protein
MIPLWFKYWVTVLCSFRLLRQGISTVLAPYKGPSTFPRSLQRLLTIIEEEARMRAMAQRALRQFHHPDIERNLLHNGYRQAEKQVLRRFRLNLPIHNLHLKAMRLLYLCQQLVYQSLTDRNHRPRLPHQLRELMRCGLIRRRHSRYVKETTVRVSRCPHALYLTTIQLAMLPALPHPPMSKQNHQHQQAHSPSVHLCHNADGAKRTLRP